MGLKETGRETVVGTGLDDDRIEWPDFQNAVFLDQLSNNIHLLCRQLYLICNSRQFTKFIIKMPHHLA